MTDQNVQTNRHGPKNKGCNQASADSKHYLVSKLCPSYPQAWTKELLIEAYIRDLEVYLGSSLAKKKKKQKKKKNKKKKKKTTKTTTKNKKKKKKKKNKKKKNKKKKKNTHKKKKKTKQKKKKKQMINIEYNKMRLQQKPRVETPRDAWNVKQHH